MKLLKIYKFLLVRSSYALSAINLDSINFDFSTIWNWGKNFHVPTALFDIQMGKYGKIEKYTKCEESLVQIYAFKWKFVYNFLVWNDSFFDERNGGTIRKWWKFNIWVRDKYRSESICNKGALHEWAAKSSTIKRKIAPTSLRFSQIIHHPTSFRVLKIITEIFHPKPFQRKNTCLFIRSKIEIEEKTKWKFWEKSFSNKQWNKENPLPLIYLRRQDKHYISLDDWYKSDEWRKNLQSRFIRYKKIKHFFPFSFPHFFFNLFHRSSDKWIFQTLLMEIRGKLWSYKNIIGGTLLSFIKWFFFLFASSSIKETRNASWAIRTRSRLSNTFFDY